jgi:hypothetical protein
MLTNPISGKIIKNVASKKRLFEIVNNYFPNKYKLIPNPPNVVRVPTRVTDRSVQSARLTPPNLPTHNH